MASKTGGFASNPFHGTSITKEHVSVVIDQVKVWLVEDSSGVSLRDRETNCVGEALAEWPCGHFDAFSIMSFGVTGCDAIDVLAWCQSYSPPKDSTGSPTYSEMLQVIHSDLVTEKMKQGILQHAAMTVPAGCQFSSCGHHGITQDGCCSARSPFLFCAAALATIFSLPGLLVRRDTGKLCLTRGRIDLG